MLFDQIQVITPAVETKNRHLAAPFFHSSPRIPRKLANIFWHKLCSDQGPNAFPTPLQLFHELLDQCFGVCISYVFGLTFKHVANVYCDQDMDVFICEPWCDPLFLCFVLVKFKIWEDGVPVSLRVLLWQSVLCFLVFALPFLDDAVAGCTEISCACCCCKKVFLEFGRGW